MNKDSDFWIMDSETLSGLQILKTFVNFVASLKYATENDRQNAYEINYMIESLDKPESFKAWNVCLDIFDQDLIYSENKKHGIYWRSWSVFFENDKLEIEAKTRHTDEPLNHYGDDFDYHSAISFKKEIPCNRIYLKKDLKEFVADAIGYKNYITDNLNEIEVDIQIR